MKAVWGENDVEVLFLGKAVGIGRFNIFNLSLKKTGKIILGTTKRKQKQKNEISAVLNTES